MPCVVPSGLVSRQGMKRDSKNWRCNPASCGGRRRASSQTARHNGHCGRLASALQDCAKADQAAGRSSSSAQPGRSCHCAACSGLAEGCATDGTAGAGQGCIAGHGGQAGQDATGGGVVLQAASQRAARARRHEGKNRLSARMLRKQTAFLPGASRESRKGAPFPLSSSPFTKLIRRLIMFAKIPDSQKPGVYV